LPRIPNADIVTPLQNGAIHCGILLDPTWLQVADDPGDSLKAVGAQQGWRHERAEPDTAKMVGCVGASPP
jgi:hypothetical protein